jgi:hypothetical protein
VGLTTLQTSRSDCLEIPGSLNLLDLSGPVQFCIGIDLPFTLLLGTRCVLYEMGAEFLGAFAKVRKATISFVISVRPFVRLSAWNNSAPTGQIFMKFGI